MINLCYHLALEYILVCLLVLQIVYNIVIRSIILIIKILTIFTLIIDCINLIIYG
jgi:hypothetical protein